MPNDPKQQKPESPAGSSTADNKKPVRNIDVQKEDASKVKGGTRRVGDPATAASEIIRTRWGRAGG